MIRFKDISIPSPCSVDYDSLPGDQVKRFCDSCRKHVYDFRGKDEAYFNSIINTHGKVCGVFYEDEIKETTTPIRSSFYQSFAAKIIGAGIFIRTLFASDPARSSPPQKHAVTQQVNDSTGIKVEHKNKDKRNRRSYSIEIFINNVFYKSGDRLDEETGFIWLPDTLKPNDQVRIIINEFKRYERTRKNHIKEYNFLFNEAEEITVKIKYHNKLIHFPKRRRRHTAGYMYC